MSEEITSNFNKIWGAIENDKYVVAKQEIETLASLDIPEDFTLDVKILRGMYYLLVNDAENALLEIESLINEIDNYPEIIKAELYSLFAKTMTYLGDISQAELTIELFKELGLNPPQETAKKIWHLTAEIDNIEGLIAVSNKHYSTSLKRFEAAIQNFRAQNRVNQMGHSLLYEAQVLFLTGKKSEAIMSLEKAEDAFKRVRNNFYLRQVYDIMIRIFQSEKNNEKVNDVTQMRDEIEVKDEEMIHQNEIYKILDRTEAKQESNVEISQSTNDEKETGIDATDSSEEEETGGDLLAQTDNENIEKLEAEIAELNNKNELLIENIEKLEKQSISFENQISQLSSQLDASQEQVIEFENEIKKSTEISNSKLEAEIEAKDQIIIQLRAEIEKSKNQDDSVGSSLEQTQQELKETSNQKNLLLYKLQETEDKLLEKERELEDLKSQLEKIDQSEDSKEDNSDKILSLEEKITQLNENNESLKSHITQLSNEKSTLEKEVASLQSKIEEINTTSKKEDTDQAKINEENETIKVENHTLKSVIDQLKVKNDQLEAEITILKNKISTDIISPVSDQEASDVGEKEPEDLEELIRSDKLIDLIYYRMKALQTIKLKVLAMQLGVNIEDCKKAVVSLHQIKALDFDEKSGKITFQS